MRFDVVTSWPRSRRRPWAAAGRFLAIGLGLVLVVVSAVGSVLPLFSTFYPVIRSLVAADLSVVEIQRGTPTPLDDLGIPIPVQLILAAACFFAGRQLLRGRRHLVLFLRRFGHRQSTHVVSAAARHIGRRWRFVTLDDAGVASVGAGVTARAASSIEAAAEVVAGVAERAADRLLDPLLAAVQRLWDASRDTVVSVWKWASASALGAMAIAWVVHLVRTADLNALETIVDDDVPWFVESYVFAAGLVVLAVALLPFAVALIVFAFGMLLYQVGSPVLLGVGAVFGAMTDSEASRTVTLSTVDDLGKATAKLEENRHNVFRPRLAVFAVDSRIWQNTVLELADESTAILIDISEPTPNVLWEIEHLRRAHPGRCVLVGDATRLRHLSGGELRDPDEIRLAELNAGQTVLAYTADRRGTRRFRSALRRRLALTTPARP